MTGAVLAVREIAVNGRPTNTADACDRDRHHDIDIRFPPGSPTFAAGRWLRR